MLRGTSYSGPVKSASGGGKLLLKGALGVGALVALVLGLDKVAHPKRPNTTPDNEYGLQPTRVCDQYGQPIIKDFRGVLWSKSTYARLDMQHLPPLHMCSETELADALGGFEAGTGAAMQKRDLPMRMVSRASAASRHILLFEPY